MREILNLLRILKDTVALNQLLALANESRYVLLLQRYKVQLTLSNFDRANAAMDDDQKQLAMEYRRKENYFLMTCAIMILFAIFAINFLSLLFQMNNFHLPLSYYILIFPFDSVFCLNWLLNYLHQFVAVALGGTFFGFNFSLTLLMMNQSCWLIDSTFISIEKLDEALKANSELHVTSHRLRTTAEAIEKIIVWLEKTQNLLEVNFFSEVTLLSILLCLFSFEMTNDPSGALIPMVAIMYMLSQFFVFCWMGSYVTSRLESLTHALQGISWDQMGTKQRKDLKLMLLMAQNINGYHGIFKPIDLTTFEDVSTSKVGRLTKILFSDNKRNVFVAGRVEVIKVEMPEVIC